jgi:hypothetical protein
MTNSYEKLGELYQYVQAGGVPKITLNQDSEETQILGEAWTALMKAEGHVRVLREALVVYANEFFYDELPPSKALEDRGDIARRVLNETDPAGVV